MKQKTAILCTLLFLAGIQVSFGQALKALPYVEPKNKNDKPKPVSAKPAAKTTTNNNQPIKYDNFRTDKTALYVFIQMEDTTTKTEYYSQVFNANDFSKDSADFNIRNASIRAAGDEALAAKGMDSKYFWWGLNGNQYKGQPIEDAEEDRQLDIQRDKQYGYTVIEYTIDVHKKSKAIIPWYVYIYCVTGTYDAKNIKNYYSQIINANNVSKSSVEVENDLKDAARKAMTQKLGYSDPTLYIEVWYLKTTDKQVAEKIRQNDMQKLQSHAFVDQFTIDVPKKTKPSKSLHGKQNKK